MGKEVDLFATEPADPFDTSAAEEIVAVDPFETNNTDDTLQSDTLKPESGGAINKSESFDPFDTSIAEGFGKTELKVLESEFIPNQPTGDEDDFDFDFDPRADEEPKKVPCLLTSSEVEASAEPVLQPNQDLVDDFDPFDTSIAAKVAIKTLEDEFLPQPTTEQKILEKELLANEDKPQNLISNKPQVKPLLLKPARPASPACLLAATPIDENP